jgi:NifU-like protein involved in Fe-S cluster formation
VSEPLYTRDILRLASAIPHLGLLDDPDGAADLRSPTCGSRVVVTVRLDGQGRVLELGQKVTACAFGQASAALMAAHAIGQSKQQLGTAVEAIEDWLRHRVQASPLDTPWPGFEILDPARSWAGRHGAILLPFRALLAAIEDAA